MPALRADLVVNGTNVTTHLQRYDRPCATPFPDHTQLEQVATRSQSQRHTFHVLNRPQFEATSPDIVQARFHIGDGTAVAGGSDNCRNPIRWHRFSGLEQSA